MRSAQSNAVMLLPSSRAGSRRPSRVPSRQGQARIRQSPLFGRSIGTPVVVLVLLVSRAGCAVGVEDMREVEELSGCGASIQGNLGLGSFNSARAEIAKAGVFRVCLSKSRDKAVSFVLGFGLIACR